MGSGKSSVGYELASALKFSFTDLDTEIEKEEGTTISTLFADKGEIYFRKKENEALKRLIDTENNLVIATGGGTPCYGDTIHFLNTQKKVVTIYLNTSLETLTTRLFIERSDRPLIAHLNTQEELKDFIRKHLFERAHYYNQAQFKVETDNTSVSKIVEAIVAQLF